MKPIGRLLLALACAVVGVGACASGSGPPEKFLQVYVSVFGFGDARVGAVLIDREGRRTGWVHAHAIDQIPGCMYGAGSDEGIPDENAPEDAMKLSPADTVPGHAEPTPVYHYFAIRKSTGTPSLLHEGGCQLRLDPTAAGHVTLALTGSGIGFDRCQDTTSVTVHAGVPSRWWLSWRASSGKCTVTISRMAGAPKARAVK